MSEVSTNKKRMSAIIGKSRLKKKKPLYSKEVQAYRDANLIIPDHVEKFLGEAERKVLSNLVRGLKVGKDETHRAKTSLHRARRIVIKKMIAYSYTDTEICMELEISGIQLHQYKRALYKEEIEALDKSTGEEQFVQYRHLQMEVVKDIDLLVENFKNSNNVNALSNALKTKSDIIRDIATKAQEMGLMTRKPNELKLVNDVDLTKLSTVELMELNEKQLELIRAVGKGELTSTSEINNVFKLRSVK